jgi:hypothetical protein
MTLSRIGLVTASLLAASCSLTSTRASDTMCSEISQFALSSRTDIGHSVTLRGGWGGGKPDTLMTHACTHSGYEPGVRLCEYLVPNTSWEFGDYNAKRAIACLDSKDKDEILAKLDQGNETVELTSSLQRVADKQIQVTVRFGYESNGLSSLTISTAGAPSH